MDEVLVNNFMVFADLVDDEQYDLWVADEGLGRRLLPARESGTQAQRVRLVHRLRRLGADAGRRSSGGRADRRLQRRDGRADRSLPAAARPGTVRRRPGRPHRRTARSGAADDRTTGPERNFDFTGYITGFDPAEVADRDALRTEFGWRDDERICLVTAGGTRVGEPFIRKVIAALPAIRERVDGMRMVVVAGPRIEAADLVAGSGRGTGAVDVHAYVPDLHRRLAACDVAVVQGGLTTTMELITTGRPFIYVPIRHHFEQSFHVAHRLDRYRAGAPDGLWRPRSGPARRCGRGGAGAYPVLSAGNHRRRRPGRGLVRRALVTAGRASPLIGGRRSRTSRRVFGRGLEWREQCRGAVRAIEQPPTGPALK